MAALASYFLIPQFGWHSAFAAGSVPLLYAFAVWKRLPESVPYLIAAGRAEEAHALVCRLEAESGVAQAAEMIVPTV